MKVLLVGGTGVISTGVAAEVIARGMELWVLNRGNNPERLPREAHLITVDYDDADAVMAAMLGIPNKREQCFLTAAVQNIKRLVAACFLALLHLSFLKPSLSF